MVPNNIKTGDLAPDFVLNAANADGQFTLASVLESGPVILEFLRGTW